MSLDAERPLRFDELRLLTNGGVIVDGTLRVIVDGPLAEALRPPADAMLVANFVPRYTRGSLTLMPPTPVQPDGWRDWRPPILDVWIERAFPNLEHAQGFRREPIRFSATIPLAHLLGVHQRFPADKPSPFPTIFAKVSSVEGVATPGPSGLLLQMTGPIAPTKANEHVPALVDARLECDVLVPWTYLRAIGSPLAFSAVTKAAPQIGAWRPAGQGPRSLALAGAMAFFDGHLALRGQRTDLYPDRPFLRTRVTEGDTTLQGAADLWLYADGFVWPSRSSSGPELVLQLGYADFGRMLGQQRSAVLDLRGEGIGHVDGQTGWVMEAGGPCTQPMTACRVSLERTDTGLRVTLTGELAPLPAGHWAKSLGPEFEASFHVPNDYLLLCQWPISNVVQEWRNRFGIKFE